MTSETNGTRRTGGRKHTEAQRCKRRAVIARLALKCRNYQSIADRLAEKHPELAVSASMVQKDLLTQEKAWRREFVEMRETQKAKELQQLLELRQVAWECLERTIGKRKTVTKEGKPGADGAEGTERLRGTKISVKEEELAGSPGLIQQLIEINKQIRALMGLDEPQAFEVSGRDGKPIEHVHYDFKFSDFAAAFNAIAFANAERVEGAEGNGSRQPVDPGRAEIRGLPEPEAGAVPDGPV